MKTNENNGFSIISKAIGQSVPIFRPSFLRIDNAINGFEHNSYWSALNIKYTLILYLGLCAVSSFGHDQIVHEAITANAVTSASKHSSAYVGFLNTIAPDDFLVKNASDFMVQGVKESAV